MKTCDQLPFEPEVLNEFGIVCEFLSGIFSKIWEEGSDFEIGEAIGSHRSIDLFIKEYKRISPSTIEFILPEIRAFLRERRYYWCVRVWVYKPAKQIFQDDMCTWLEIDRYSILPFRGKKMVEQFEDMDAFCNYFWSATNSMSLHLKD